jgi:murein DD-endopeptidase MepM/ murein hydrolase activator NlpD
LRRLLAALLAVVPLAAASLPALAAETGVDALRSEWLSNREAVDEALTGLEALDEATAQAVDEFEAVQQRLASARQRLLELRAELRRAVVRQRKAEAANLVAIQRLGQATMIMVTIEGALAEHAADLDTEVVAAYKYAGSSARFGGIVDALISSGSLTDFTTAYDKLQSATANQARLVNVVTVLAERLGSQRELVAALQRQTAKAERLAIDERARVARLTRQQTQLVEQIARDRRISARLVKELERRTAEVVSRLDELQAQSDQLMAELSKYSYVGGLPGSKDLLWPTDGPATSGFGSRIHPIFKERRLHAGIDIPAPTGQAVFAVRDGTVLSASYRGGYGNAVVIDHGDGMSTVYAHLSAFCVRGGEQVSAGDDIGKIGSTGNSTGPHLHFEIRLAGRPTNPMEWY